MITERLKLAEQYEGKWTAIYLPSDGALKSLDRYDLESKDAAEEYVLSKMCRHCKEGRQRILDGISDPDNNEEHIGDSLWPGCACEWEVMPTQDYAQCESFGDIMEAADAKLIYRRPE